MRLTIRLLIVLAGAAIGVTLSATIASAKPPPGGPGALDQERFNGTTSVSCTSTGLTYTASGVATGNVNGTFTETGTVTFPPLGSPGTVTALAARFVIYDGVTGKKVVTGTKTLSNLFPGNGMCNPMSLQLPHDEAFAVVAWTAHFKHPKRTAQGNGDINIFAGTFSEDFALIPG